MFKTLVNIWHKILSLISQVFGIKRNHSPLSVHRGSTPSKTKTKTIQVVDERPELTPSYSVVKDFPPILRDAMPQIFEIQKGAMRLILGYFDIPYLPQLAVDVINDLKQDPVNCFFEFLRRLRINPDRLLVDRSPIETQKLLDSVGILLEADDIRREYDVSPVPIYEALLESTTSAEHMLDNMRLVAKTLSRLNKKNPAFFEYSQWLDSVRAKLEHWERYSAVEIEDVLKYAEQCEVLQTQYDKMITSIRSLIQNLKSSDSWISLVRQVDQRVKEIRVIESHLLNIPELDETATRMGVEECLNLLAAIHEELREFYRNAVGIPYATDDINLVKEAKKALGLPDEPTEAQIKTAYRKLAMKYHPDRNPHDPTAAKKFIKIDEAYKLLLSIMKTAEVHYA